MRPLLILREALRAIGRNPLRAALVLATLALGYASVLVTVATVEGGRQALRHDLETLATDVVACLSPGRIGPLSRVGSLSKNRLDVAAVNELRVALGDEAVAVIPFRMELGGWRQFGAAFVGLARAPAYMVTTSEFAGVLKDPLVAGRFLAPDEHFGPECSVVLDEALARQMDPDPRALVGRTLDLQRSGEPFRGTVVGVLRDPISLRRQMDTFESSLSLARSVTSRRLEFKNVYLPFDETRDEPSGALIRVRDVERTTPLVDRMLTILKARGIEPWVHVQRDWARDLIEMVDRFSLLAQFFWMADLFVVLILGATIATLAMQQRAIEFAVRRVEGAALHAVVLPVAIEAAILGLIAVPTGALLAWALFDRWVEPVLRWPPVVPTPLAIATATALVAVAVLSYAWPAARVARRAPAVVLAGSG